MDGGQFFGDVVMFRLRDIRFRKGKRTKPFEYWCQDCKQLRLSCVTLESCGNCGSTRIIKGQLNTLKRE